MTDRRVLQRLTKTAKKGPVLPHGSFIALGQQTEATKLATIGSGVKREASGSGASYTLPKKPKIEGFGETHSGPMNAAQAIIPKRETTSDLLWQRQPELKVAATNFLDSLYDVETDRVAKICTVLKRLHDNRVRFPEPVFALALCCFVRDSPDVLADERPIVECLCALLKKPALKVGLRPNVSQQLLACSMLMTAFQGEPIWPPVFYKVYLEDSLNDRHWVDRPECRCFVENILTAFQYRPLPIEFVALFHLHEPASEFAAPLLQTTHVDEESTDSMEQSNNSADGILVSSENKMSSNRFELMQSEIYKYVDDLFTEMWVKMRDNPSKNILKTMTVCCHYSEIREKAGSKMDQWLQNPKLQRFALELLMSVCLNTTELKGNDGAVLNAITKLRLKSKMVITQYCQCLRTLFAQRSEYCGIILRSALNNEVSVNKIPHNGLIAQVCLQYDPSIFCTVFAGFCIELVTSHPDALRTVRAIVREFVRNHLKNEFPLESFIQALLQSKSGLASPSDEVKLRVFRTTVDIFCLTLMSCITSNMKDIAISTTNSKTDRQKDSAVALKQYKLNVTSAFIMAVNWLKDVIPIVLNSCRPFTIDEYRKSFYKMLFLLDKSDAYTGIDGWPGEQDRNAFLRIITDCPVSQTLLLNILNAQNEVDESTGRLSLRAEDEIDLCEQLIRRAALNEGDALKWLNENKCGMVISILFACISKHAHSEFLVPHSINLGAKSLIWKCWFMLLVLSAHNPDSIGQLAWITYPTLRILMHMVMTNDYEFPPASSAVPDRSLGQIRSLDLQERQLEKDEILNIESHLFMINSGSDVPIDVQENNSRLLHVLTRFNPSGEARCPPQEFLDSIRDFNLKTQLGLKLCSSRNPDFLLDVISRQGSTQSFAWLIQLIESHEGSLNILPIQCLCEFLLRSIDLKRRQKLAVEYGYELPREEIEESRFFGIIPSKDKERRKKERSSSSSSAAQRSLELKNRLKSVVWDWEKLSEAETVLNYFVMRLHSSASGVRETAVEALITILEKSAATSIDPFQQSVPEIVLDEFSWLCVNIPSVPPFNVVNKSVCAALRLALLVETKVISVVAYVHYLSEYCDNAEETVKALSDLLINRKTFLSFLFPQNRSEWTYQSNFLIQMLNIFDKYFSTAGQGDQEFQWEETDEKVLVQWHDDAKSALLDVQIIFGSIIVLTYPVDKEGEPVRKRLMDMWFSADGIRPMVMLLDMSAEANLLPDWLKLRIIVHSHDEQLKNVALHSNNLDLDECLLFLQQGGLDPSIVQKILIKLDEFEEPQLKEGIEKCKPEQIVLAVQAHWVRGCSAGRIFLKKVNLADVDSGEITSTRVLSSPIKFDRRESAIEAMDTTSKLTTEPTTTTDYDTLVRKCFESVQTDDTDLAWSGLFLLLSSIKTEDSNDQSKLDIICIEIDHLSKNLKTEFKKAIMVHETNCIALLRILKSRMKLMEDLFKRVCSVFMKSCSGKVFAVASNLSGVSATVEELKSKKSKSSIPAVMTPYLKKILSSDAPNGSTAGCLMKLLECLKMPNITSEQRRNLFAWFNVLDPELVSAAPHVELKAIFGAAEELESESKNWTNTLPHSVSMQTLKKTVDLLLNDFDKELDCNRVLEFLDACIYLPRIWRGCDDTSIDSKELGVSIDLEDILCLERSQLLNLLRYLLGEMRNIPLNSASAESVEMILAKRKQLISVSILDAQRAKWSLEFLIGSSSMQAIKLSPHDKQCRFLLAFEIYLNVPSVKKCIQQQSEHDNLFDQLVSYSYLSVSKFDKLCWGLIMELYDLCRLGKPDTMLTDIHVGLLKLVSAHPSLFVRQLPQLSALLHDCSHRSAKELWKSGNMYAFIERSVQYLEHVELHAFNSQFAAPFLEAIGALFYFIERHAVRNPKYINMVDATLKMIQKFNRFDGVRTSAFLQTYSSLLQAISMRYTNMTVIKSIMKEITLPLPPINPESTVGELVASPVVPLSPCLPTHVAPLFSKFMKASTAQEMLACIEELKTLGTNKSHCLQHFREPLQFGLKHSNEQCRTECFCLIINLLTEDPSQTSSIIGTFLTCLQSENQSIVESALEYLSSYVLLCGEYSNILMERAFLASLSFPLVGDICKYISDAVEAINYRSTTNKPILNYVTAVS